MAQEISFEEKPKCPDCQSDSHVIPVVYGMPTKELLDKDEKGEIQFAGRVSVNGREPPWTCMYCGILID